MIRWLPQICLNSSLKLVDTMSEAIKRCLDVWISVVMLIFVLPICIAIAIYLKLSSEEPVFFLQTRTGRYGCSFVVIKFRTMDSVSNGLGEQLSDAARLTRFGKFLRRFSLDELPQLINVVKGEMSLVGPRPLLPEYIELYSRFQSRRLQVKPGLTGIAQIRGRNSLTWKKRFQLDFWYVENRSLLLDLKIMLCTVVTIFSGRGVADASGTMTKFGA